MLTAIITAPTIDGVKDQVLQASGLAECFEWRLDFLENLDLDAVKAVRSALSLPVIFTLRSVAQGGVYKGPEEQRLHDLTRLIALSPDYMDVEHDVSEHFITALAEKNTKVELIRSYHNFNDTPDDLRAILTGLFHDDVTHYKLITTANSTLDGLRVAKMVQETSGELSLAAHAMGAKGEASRMIAAAVGSRFVYARLDDGPCPAPGVLGLRALSKLYRVKTMYGNTDLFALLGHPVAHSVGHVFHNCRFRHEGRDATYVKLDLEGHELPAFFDMARTLPFKGFSVTMPHKAAVLDYCDVVDDRARTCGAANTLTLMDGHWRATNTDGQAVADALEAKISLRGASILIAGMGGAARAIAHELASRGAKLTLLNRTYATAQRIASQLGGTAYALDGHDWASASYDAVIKALPSHVEAWDEALVGACQSHGVGMDVNYVPRHSLFLKLLADAGVDTLNGRAMFLRQAHLQQELWKK